MFRLIIMAWMLFLAFLCASSIEFDGVIAGRSMASVNVVQLQVGHRVVAFGTRSFRPGRMYWQVAIY